MKSTVAMMVLVVTVAGCETSRAVVQAHAGGRVFQAPYDEAWDLALHTLMELGYSVSSAHKGDGRIVGERQDHGSRVQDYTSGTADYVLARWWSLHVTQTILVRPIEPGQIRVTPSTSLLGEATIVRLGMTQIPLRSNGLLERQYLDALADSLTAANTVPHESPTHASSHDKNL